MQSRTAAAVRWCLLLLLAFAHRALGYSCSECIAQGRSWCEYRQKCVAPGVAATQNCWSGPVTNASNAWRETSCPAEYRFADCAANTYVQLPGNRPISIALAPAGAPYYAQLNCTWFVSPQSPASFAQSGVAKYDGSQFVLDGRNLGPADSLALYDIQRAGQFQSELPDYGAVLLFSVQGPAPQLVTQAVVRMS